MRGRSVVILPREESSQPRRSLNGTVAAVAFAALATFTSGCAPQADKMVASVTTKSPVARATPPGARASVEAVTVTGRLSATRPIQWVEVVVNGHAVPVSRDVRVQQADVQSHPFNAQVEPRPGENVIVVTAIDTSGNGHMVLVRK
jgi:hypothetical protein